MTYSQYLQQFVGKKVEGEPTFCTHNSGNVFLYYEDKKFDIICKNTIISVGDDFIIVEDEYRVQHCIPIHSFFLKINK